MARYKTFANSGTLTPNDLNQLQSQVSGAFVPWRTYARVYVTQSHSIQNSLLIPTVAFGAASYTTSKVGGLWQGALGHLIRIESMEVGELRRVVMRVRMMIMTNGEQGGYKIVGGLYPILKHISPGSSTEIGSQISIAPYAGSSVESATLGNLQQIILYSGEFTMPQEGDYVLGYIPTTTGGVVSATAWQMIRFDLQYKVVHK